MRKFTHQLIYALCIFLLIGCEKEIIIDPIDPRLPIYSEKAHNVAGALINDQKWTNRLGETYSSPEFDRPEIIIDTIQSIMSFNMYGVISDFNFRAIDTIHISFEIQDVKVKSFEMLPDLEGQIFHLSDNAHRAWLFDQDSSYQTDNTIGQLFFKRVDLLDASTCVLSGTFGFDFIDSNGIKNTVYKGRFDFYIRRDRDVIFE